MQEILTLLLVLVVLPLTLHTAAYCFHLLLVAIHEAGHLLACKIVGYRWNVLIIGPWKIDKTGGKARLTSSGQRFGGLVCPEYGFARSSIGRNIFLSLGGVLMNLLTGALSLAAIPFVPRDLSNLNYLLLLFAFASFMVAVVNSLPVRVCGEITDGLMIREMLRGRTAHAGTKELDPAAEQARYDALMQLNRFREAGQRARDWDSAMVRAAVASGGADSNSAIAAYLAFYWAEDSGDSLAAGRYVGRAVHLMDKVDPSFRPYLPLDSAYYKAFYERDPVAARVLFTKACSLLPDTEDDLAAFRCSLLRTEAAILLSEGRYEEAMANANEAVACLSDEHCGEKYMLERLILACGKFGKEQNPSGNSQEGQVRQSHE